MTEQDVQQRLHEPAKFTADEIKVAVGIVNSFRPFSPKRDADHPIPSNILAIGPICQLFNSILRATGYSEFTKKLCPLSSCGKLQPIPLGATGICEALCAKGPRHFDVLDSKSRIRSLTTGASRPDTTRLIFASFFNMDKVLELCKRHGLVFADRQVSCSCMQTSDFVLK